MLHNAPPAQGYAQPPAMLRPGDTVFALWRADGFYYAANIAGINGNQADIAFMDGARGMMTLGDIIPVNIALSRMTLYGNWRNGGSYYKCRLQATSGSTVTVLYEDGYVETMPIGMLRASNPPLMTQPANPYPQQNTAQQHASPYPRQNQPLTLSAVARGTVKGMDRASAEEYMRKVFIVTGGPTMFDSGLSITKDIPEKKLAAAIKSYAQSAANEIPLMLNDAAIFRNGKAGFLLTDQALYFSRQMDKPVRVPLEEITGISHDYAVNTGLDGSNLIINSYASEWQDICLIALTGNTPKITTYDTLVKILSTMTGLPA